MHFYVFYRRMYPEQPTNYLIFATELINTFVILTNFIFAVWVTSYLPPLYR